MLGAIGQGLSGLASGIEGRRGRAEKKAEGEQQDRLLKLWEKYGLGEMPDLGAIASGDGGTGDDAARRSGPSGTPDAGSPWIRYSNARATRSRPISADLASNLSYLKDMGLTAEVFSGGQPGIEEGGARVGSTRHDHGGAADVFLYRGDERLDWANPEHQPIFAEVVRRGKQAGITGWGAGPGYMQPGSMHVGYGAPAVWGAEGRSANAPQWLVDAYNAPPAERLMAMGAVPVRRGGR